MNRYRAAGADTRGRRRSVLQTLIRKRMTAYDPAENAKKGEVVPQFVIECEEAISN